MIYPVITKDKNGLVIHLNGWATQRHAAKVCGITFDRIRNLTRSDRQKLDTFKLPDELGGIVLVNVEQVNSLKNTPPHK